MVERIVSKRLFAAGQPVICINDNFKRSRKKFPGLNFPTFGKRYTVRDYVCDGKYPAIVLHEIRNHKVRYMNGDIQEGGFWDVRFVGASSPVKAKRAMKKEVV
jgi:hypothetical protein